MNETSGAARTVVVERAIAQPPEKIWRALTQPHLIEAWLMKNDFAPVAGHRFRFRLDPQPGWDGVIACEVLAIEPNRNLSYTWRALGLDSVVVWTLTPTDSGTLLRMEQSGFRPEQRQAYQGAQYGWQTFFAKLEQHLAQSA